MTFSRICVDIDDTVVYWTAGFKRFIRDEKGIPVKGLPTSWDLGPWLGVADNRVRTLIDEFQSSDRYRYLEPMEFSRTALRIAKNRGYDIVGITACGTHSKVVSARRQNINDLYGDVFSDIICVNHGIDKEPHLKKLFRPGDIWVEDNVPNAMTGHAIGYRTFVIDQPHNRAYRISHPELEFVQDWIDLGLKILD